MQIKQRLVRVLVYEGTPEWIQDCMKRRGVKGSYTVPQGVIKEAIVGDFLEDITPIIEENNDAL